MSERHELSKNHYEQYFNLLLEERMKHRLNYNCLCSYIQRKLKDKHPDMSISVVAVHEMDNLLKDFMEQVGKVSRDLLKSSGKSTLTTRSLATACKIVLPKNLHQCSKGHGIRAMEKYKMNRK